MPNSELETGRGLVRHWFANEAWVFDRFHLSHCNDNAPPFLKDPSPGESSNPTPSRIISVELGAVIDSGVAAIGKVVQVELTPALDCLCTSTSRYLCVRMIYDC